MRFFFFFFLWWCVLCDGAHDRYGFNGLLFYFLYMAVAAILLMNILLAILVDAYISIKAESDKADGVFTDMYRQSKASMRAMRRQKGIMGNREVVDVLEDWLQRRDPTARPEEEHVPIGNGYTPTHQDLVRVLRVFLESELGLQHQAESDTPYNGQHMVRARWGIVFLVG